MSDTAGLYGKYTVQRTDGGTSPGGRHHGCLHFVLDLTHDEHARTAAAFYAWLASGARPELTAELAEVLGIRRAAAVTR